MIIPTTSNSRLRKRPLLLLLTSFLLITSLLGFISIFRPSYTYRLHNALSYATRPLWDKPDGPRNILSHYYADGMRMDDTICSIHGWAPRSLSGGIGGGGQQVRVLDAVLMSSELDLLEIRLHELDSVVDRFFIVESNATFTGLPKKTYFADNRARFREFEDKIDYHFLPGFPLKSGEDAWAVEARTRDFMAAQLQLYISSLPSGTQSLIIMSDIDEIPAQHTIALLRTCEFGKSLHLLMRNYLYSFEWYLGMSSWRASVHVFTTPSPGEMIAESGSGSGLEMSEGPNVFYRHSLSSPSALSDAGWHCSFCFRSLQEYETKMRGFSHSDRLGGVDAEAELLDVHRIQTVICEGSDIFGMLPEAYSYGDLLSQLYLRPSRSAVHIPKHILANTDRYRFLLPGGCVRDE